MNHVTINGLRIESDGKTVRVNGTEYVPAPDTARELEEARMQSYLAGLNDQTKGQFVERSERQRKALDKLQRKYNTMKGSLLKQRDELKARVAELEEALRVAECPPMAVSICPTAAQAALAERSKDNNP